MLSKKNVVLVIPVLITSCMILYFTTNFPYFDDYWRLLKFLNIYVTKDGFEAVSYIFHPDNIDSQHNNLVIRLFSVLEYHLFGHASFRSLGIVAYFFYLLFVFVVVSNIKQYPFKVAFTYLSLSLLFFSVFFWSFVAFQHFITLATGTIAMYIVEKKERNILVPFVLCVVATYNFGNGFIIFSIIFAKLLFDKSYKKAIIWLIMSAFVVLIYFYSYNGVKVTPHVLTALKSKIFFLVLLVGGFYTNTSYFLLQSIFGIALICMYLFSLRRFYKTHENAFSIMLMTFLFLSLVMVAFNRYSIGFEYSVTNRYKLYSVLFSFFVIYYNFYKAKIKGIFMTFSIFIFTLSYIFFFDAVKSRKDHLTSVHSDFLNNSVNNLWSEEYKKQMGTILLESIDKGVYKSPIGKTY